MCIFEVQFLNGLPTDWRRQLSTNYSLCLTYSHPFSARSFNLSFQVLCNRLLHASLLIPADVQFIGMRLTGLCANVDESILLLDFNVFFKDFDYNQSESHLLHLPMDVLLELMEKLPFRSFFNLCLSCSTMWNNLYENDYVWKVLLRRDFRDIKQYDCYKTRYIELYVGSSQQARFRANRPALAPNSTNDKCDL
uniref:F-box domain-containing protein n=1 Tax=Romanomermis culicivorax TaxID=13658 RepID=A0A915JDF3_ROMCU